MSDAYDVAADGPAGDSAAGDRPAPQVAVKERAAAESAKVSTNGSRRRLPAPTYLTYAVEVVATEALGPTFRRLTFASDQLRDFGAGGHDQRIKLVLPRPGQSVADLPSGEDWYVEWRAMPEDVRPTMRTYTVRAFRPEQGELDVDFVLHGVDAGDSGPAASWAATARSGDQVGLVGPDRPGRGRMWGCEWSPPATTKRLLLAGDETAVPAMAAIVESLPPEARGIVCVEVPHPGDQQVWRHPRGIEVRWLARGDDSGAAVPHGTLLEPVVAEAMETMCRKRPVAAATGPTDPDADSGVVWDVPEVAFDDAHTEPGDLYGWLAGEAGMIKRLRRAMVNDFGVPRSAVAFMGYWRLGRPEVN